MTVHRGNAATSGRVKPSFHVVAISGALAAVGLSIAVGVFSKAGRRCARRRNDAELASPGPSGDRVQVLNKGAGVLPENVAANVSWAIQVYQPWKPPDVGLETRLLIVAQGTATPQRLPKLALDVKTALLASDDERFGAASCDSDVYDSDTGAGTPCSAGLSAGAATNGLLTECSDDVDIFYGPHDMGFFESEDVAGVAAESVEMAFAAGLAAIHAPYAPDEPIAPRTPDSLSAAAAAPPPSPSPPPPPPLSPRGSLGRLQLADSWASIEAGPAEETPPPPPPPPNPKLPSDFVDGHPEQLQRLEDDHDDRDDLLPSTYRAGFTGSFTFQPFRATGPEPMRHQSSDASLYLEGLLTPLRSVDWALVARASNASSDDGFVSIDSGCASLHGSPLGGTSDGSSLGRPVAEASSAGTYVAITVTMGNPLFVKTSPPAGGGVVVVGGLGAQGDPGRARRRLSYETTVDNPCFTESATTVNNPCFGSNEFEGAVPALLSYSAVGLAAAAAATGSTTAAEAGARAQWHPRNPLAEETSIFCITSWRTKTPPQQLSQFPLEQRSQTQKPPVEQAEQPPEDPTRGTPSKVEAAEADDLAPPVTPEKPPPLPLLASATPDSPSSQQRQQHQHLVLATSQPAEPGRVGVATAPFTTLCSQVVDVELMTASTAATPTSAQPPRCSSAGGWEPRGSGLSFDAELSEAQPRYLSPGLGSAAVLFVGGPRGRSAAARGPVPRSGCGSSSRPPWRPAACPCKALGGGALPAAGAAVYRRGSVRSRFASSISAGGTSPATQHEHQQQRHAPGIGQPGAELHRPPLRPPSKYAGGVFSLHGAATRGSAARTATDGAPDVPGFMRPTQAYLLAAVAAASGGGSGSGSAVESRVGRRGEELQRATADNRPRWR